MSRASRAASTLQEIGHRRQDFNPPLTPERGAVHPYTILLRHLPGALPGEVALWCTSNTSLLFGIQLTSQDSNPDRRGPKPRVLPLHYWSIGTLGDAPPPDGYRANDSRAARPYPLILCLLALKYPGRSNSDLNRGLPGFNRTLLPTKLKDQCPAHPPGQREKHVGGR